MHSRAFLSLSHPFSHVEESVWRTRRFNPGSGGYHFVETQLLPLLMAVERVIGIACLLSPWTKLWQIVFMD